MVKGSGSWALWRRGTLHLLGGGPWTSHWALAPSNLSLQTRGVEAGSWWHCENTWIQACLKPRAP